MNRVPRSLGIFLLALTGLLILQGRPALANGFDGFDIVLLVDQSGSMWGVKRVHPTPNDPNGHRFFGPPYTAAFLGLDRQFHHPGATYRLGVVNFDDSAELTLPLTPLGTGNRAEWEKELDRISASLSKQSWVARNPMRKSGSTNIKAAFELAARMLKAVRKPGRPQVIVLLTDGRPSVHNEDFRQHLTSLEKFVSQSLPGVKIYVVGIRDDGGDGYWEDTKDHWERIVKPGGWAELLAQDFQISQAFHRILSEQIPGLQGGASGSGSGSGPVLVQAGPYPMRPYLQLWQLSAFKATTNEGIELTRPDGSLVKKGDFGVTWTGQDSFIEQVQVANPEPGDWRIAKKGNFEIQFAQIQIPAQIKLIPLGKSVPLFSTLDIRYEVLDADGKPLPEYKDPRYALDATCLVEGPGQESLSLSKTGTVYAAQFTPKVLGTYGLDFKATSKDSSGASFEVATRQDRDLFEVLPVDGWRQVFYFSTFWGRFLLPLLALAAAWWLLNNAWLRRRWPCEGSLVVSTHKDEHADARTFRIPLESLGRNRITLRSFPAWTRLTRIEVSHRQGQQGVTLQEVRNDEKKTILRNRDVSELNFVALEDPKFFVRYSRN